MTLRKREKILAIAAGADRAAPAGPAAVGRGLALAGSARLDRDRLADEVAKRQDRVEAAVEAAAQLKDWEHRSLPADPANARSLYQRRLREWPTGTGCKNWTCNRPKAIRSKASSRDSRSRSAAVPGWPN